MNETIIMFKEDSIEAVNYKTRDIILKENIISEIRNKKQNDEIINYEIKDLVRNKEFVITYKDGSKVKIDINKKEYYAISLEILLKKNKKIYDEVIYSITGGNLEKKEDGINTFAPWEAIGSIPDKEEKIVKSPLEIINYIKCLYQNDEVTSFEKKGSSNLEYTIITTEDEKIRVITDSNNNAVPLLEDIYMAYYQNKKSTKTKKAIKTFAKIVIIAGAIALVSQNPHVEKTVKLVKGKIVEWNNEEAAKDKFQDNLLLISFYHSQLKIDALSKEEYDIYVSLLNESIAYCEEYDKIDTVDYEILIEYKQEADSKYEEIRRKY